MKLCRFQLAEDARPKTGIFHDGHIYETDGEHALGLHRPEAVTLLSPVNRPQSLRIFNAYQQNENEAPMFAFGCTDLLIGPEQSVTLPADASEIDFELHVAAIIGQGGENLSLSEAGAAILGFTVLNSWVNRIAEKQEREVGYGIGKSRDFGTSVGPFIVTPEELEDKTTNTEKGFVYDLNMKALINGKVVGSANLSEMRFTFAELICEASRDSKVSDGDVIASGSPPQGSCLSIGCAYLKAGDTVTLIVERLGTLENRIESSLY